MPRTLFLPPPIASVVTMPGRPAAAADGQRPPPRYLRTRGVIDAVEEVGSLVPWGQYDEQPTFRCRTFPMAQNRKRFRRADAATNGARVSLGLNDDEQVFELPARLFEQLPFAVYICDRNGLVVRYNHRAAELWGRTPKLGDPNERFCGSYKMFRPDGSLLPHHQCPMADVLHRRFRTRAGSPH